MKVEVNVIHIPVVNFAMQQNHVPIIREINIKNTGKEDLKAVCVSISFEPDFAAPCKLRIESIASGSEERISTVPVQLSTSFLSQLTERILGHIHIEVSAETQSLFSESYEMSLLAFDQWGGISVLPEMLAAFVTPNYPVIAPIIKRATEIMGDWTEIPALDEYQTRDPNRVKKQMAAIYEAIAEQQIAYCAVPASFEESGQRIRLYDDIMSHKLGNCLDMSLLYAGCLEAAGIHPLIVLIKGHAFAGGWLVPDSFPDSVNDDVSLLTKHAADGINELLLVETTCMNAGMPRSFDTAVASANEKLKDIDNFLLFIDVVRARNAQIRPLPLRVIRDGKVEIDDSAEERGLSAPSALSATDIIPNVDQVHVGKLTIWERKLLDLTLRNNLLNTRIFQNTLELISVQIDELEDALADGQEFQILERPQDWDNQLMNAGFYHKLHASDPVIDLVKEELKQHRLRSYLDAITLRIALNGLYRKSRLLLEENGANTLYLALGMLKWMETSNSTRPLFAPILLLPIEIIRKSAVRGYVIRSREESPMLNITLLEMLRQYFGIQIGGLDPLPRDGSGVDVSLILNTVRRAVMTQKGWDVENQAIIGNFSFNKFIMWNDIHNNADKLSRNKIVASLMSGKLEWSDDESAESGNVDLDEKYPAGEIALPIEADSSQFEAICAAVEDKSFILHGPPGTGKSQTITNIIANALYKGKKVLFVAEKMAALQVVQHRLESIGIAPFCLELHSNKTKKTNVLEQLKRTTEVTKRKSKEEYRIEAEQINALRHELNDYVYALHKRHKAGLSLYDCFSGYVSVDSGAALIDLPETLLQELDEEGRITRERMVEEYSAACRICENPKSHPLRGIGLTVSSPVVKNRARKELTDMIRMLQAYGDLRLSVASLLGLNVDGQTRAQDKAMAEIVQVLLTARDIPTGLLALDDITEVCELIDRAVQTGEERDSLRKQLLEQFDLRILTADVAAWEKLWIECRSKWKLPRILGQNRVRKHVQTYAKPSVQLTLDQLPELFSRLADFQTSQHQLDELGKTLSPILGILWKDGEAEWTRVADARVAISQIEHSLLQATRDIAMAMAAKRTLHTNLKCGLQPFSDLHADILEQFSAQTIAIDEQIAKIAKLLQSPDITKADENSIETLMDTFAEWSAHLDLLHDWTAYNRQRQELLSAGLEPVVRAFEEGRIAVCDIVNCYRKSLVKSYADYILTQEPRMSTFHGVMFEEKIRRFRSLSKHFEQLTRKELYARLASSLPSLQKEAAQSSEVGILQRNIRNGGRGTSIRRLFDQIPDLLTRMCPCMLMSPISVAQYIDAGLAPFDLVIFDEASQMPTSEAVGAIARGRNVIVVGDPNQMPPTDFFSTNTFDEDNADKEDLESILDDCLALSMPSKHLLWHYRSKHESLIAFSNVKYYDNKLLTFPSPDDLTTKVHFQYVKGTYSRGSSRHNRAEAEAIIHEIEARLTDPEKAKQSIGVVTFNSQQQSLIEDLLNDLYKENPALETMALECEEPIFIKNLENVQGDERDVILFSVGFGPDKTGRITYNFGPLNRAGGWRRLNVAVSRARYEMKVFSTLRADQIDLNRTSAEGVAGLKAFLEYAEKGRTAISYMTASEHRTTDALLRSIADELKARGYQARINVGCSGYRIDIGIVDPECPEKYLLGILCDGYNHNATRTAHDRFVTQYNVLRMLGWRLHYVWAMDWWENRERTIATLISAIEQKDQSMPPEETDKPIGQQHDEALQSAPAVSEETERNDEMGTSVQPELTDTVNNRYIKPYQVAVLDYTPVPSGDFAQGYYDSEALNKIHAVVEIEAPISRTLLCKRVLSSFAINRMGPRLSAHMDLLLGQSGFRTTGEKSCFYWDNGQDPESYDTYRPESKREALDIAPEEVAVAVCRILEEQGALPEDDLLRETAHRFNYARMGDNVTTSMRRGIDYAVESGRAIRDKGKIKAVRADQ